jgi:hypothetical protein
MLAENLRILLVGLPQMLADMLEEEIGRQSDMAVVGRLSVREALSTEVLRHGAHFILFNLDDQPLRVACDSLLRDCPDLEVLSIGGEGRVLLRCELRAQVLPLGEASVDRILELMRRPMRERTQQ